MKKNIITIISALLLSTLIAGVANAYVTSSEYVTHNDWKRMVASMSERLDYLSEQYIRDLCAENPKVKKIHDSAEKEQKGE